MTIRIKAAPGLGTVTGAIPSWLNLTVDFTRPAGLVVNVPFIESTYVSSTNPTQAYVGLQPLLSTYEFFVFFSKSFNYFGCFFFFSFSPELIMCFWNLIWHNMLWDRMLAVLAYFSVSLRHKQCRMFVRKKKKKLLLWSFIFNFLSRYFCSIWLGSCLLKLEFCNGLWTFSSNCERSTRKYGIWNIV